MKIILSTYFIVLGLWFAIRSQKLSQATVDWYLEVFGFKYNQVIYRWVFLVGGIVSLTLGLLTALGIINFD